MATANQTIKIENWADIRELVLMSIGTDKGTWWADPSFGSELYLIRQEGKISSRTAGSVQQVIMESLRWMKEDGIAAGIDCHAEQAGKYEITYTVTVVRPEGDPILIKDTWHAV
jgi:phage gp46-like protein